MTLIYGHRGARGEAPENTLISFQHCLKQGVNRCELDLHLSLDGELMVIHDPTLRRTTGRRGKISEHLADDLTTYDARLGLTHWPEQSPIPRLAELFEHCDFEHWQLEVKSASKKRALHTVLAIQNLVQQFNLVDRVTLTSSSRTVLKAAQQQAPRLSRGFVAEYSWLEPVKVAQRYGCEFLVLNWKLCTPARLKRAHQAGLHVSVWTVNEPEQMRQLAHMGVDSLITDYPSKAVLALGFTA
ncbi:glycerophosphoryl diester phosphodiesterase [Azomonas agilis]|uniref:Glycerophosphoryl diester phosphodiesterase n=1 Tax=Azomonas agilis TaxID=116849 RepID=A0A562I0D9_9GAMM|nr:glycerophosphodiester phosphodiesterase [Azomonas agilis]TWH64507.1 glycerophosphoryl diester phosphodiesterase [Azomonas agilis]